jgi:hypothetical protein
MKPESQSGIENEIRETAALETSSAITDLPNVVARNVNPFDEKVDHIDVDVDVDTPGPIDLDVDEPVNLDLETHIDQN